MWKRAEGCNNDVTEEEMGPAQNSLDKGAVKGKNRSQNLSRKVLRGKGKLSKKDRYYVQQCGDERARMSVRQLEAIRRDALGVSDKRDADEILSALRRDV